MHDKKREKSRVYFDSWHTKTEPRLKWVSKKRGFQQTSKKSKDLSFPDFVFVFVIFFLRIGEGFQQPSKTNKLYAPPKKSKDLSILDNLERSGHYKAQLCDQLPLPDHQNHQNEDRCPKARWKGSWWWSLLGHSGSSWSWLPRLASILEMIGQVDEMDERVKLLDNAIYWAL